jgi:hypothetical protein
LIPFCRLCQALFVAGFQALAGSNHTDDLDEHRYGKLLGLAGLLPKDKAQSGLWKPALLMLVYYGCFLAGPFAVGDFSWSSAGLLLGLAFSVVAFIALAWAFAWFTEPAANGSKFRELLGNIQGGLLCGV